jgi:hypothetical protein
MVIFAMLAIGRVASMGAYRDLESNGVIVTNAEKAKKYPNAELSGDWGDVAIYLTEGFRSIRGPAYAVAVIFAINAIAFFLIWRSFPKTQLADGFATGDANKLTQLNYASPPVPTEERP